MAIVVGPTLWQFNKMTQLGSSYGGGFVICKSGGVGWIVAPSSTEVSRNWHARGDAVTTAQASAACGDWFVPTCGQLKNPGYCCITYWDSYCSTNYWSSTSASNYGAHRVSLADGNAFTCAKTSTLRVRAFRCVTY